MAATTVAARVAEEMRCQLGQEVGYSIRFEDVTSSKTQIKFLTDGLLLREALVDPLLSRYSVIMVDEAHERSLSSDILLGLLKKIRKRRTDLRLIISSATLDAEQFLNFFVGPQDDETKPVEQSDGRIVSIEGRMFPVDILHSDQPIENYVDKAVELILEIHAHEHNGDILVFLTGREEIDDCVTALAEKAADIPSHDQGLQISPLYAGLSTEQQMYIFEPAPENVRKVIVATNIAEASVTIPGIVFVIDCGFVKIRAFDPKSGIDMLTAVPISQAAATQRAGRAGRTRAGKCFRLYTSSSHSSLAPSSPPEIQRSNLASTVLQLKCLGIDNIARFDFLTSPPSALLIRALEILYALGALDDYARLTKPLGTRMADLALEPQMSKVLLASTSFNCTAEVLSIAAMTTLQGSVWIYEGDRELATARWKFAADEGDHLTLLNVFLAFTAKGKRDAQWCRSHGLNFKSLTRAVSVKNQLRRALERFGIEVVEEDRDVLRAGGMDKSERIRRCLTAGYFSHAARMMPDGSFETVDGVKVHAHPSSLLFVSLHCVIHIALQEVGR